MATIDGPKYTGPLTIDLSNVQDALVDIPPGGLKGARAEQPGMDEVIKRLADAVPKHGDDADIPPKVYERFVERTDLLAKLREHELSLAKALEVCTETRTKLENDREDDVTALSKAVRGAAKKNPGIVAPFEALLAYNAQIAEKAVHTKQKKAKAEAEAEADAGVDTDSKGDSPPPA
jgi:hypothetical protein